MTRGAVPTAMGQLLRRRMQFFPEQFDFMEGFAIERFAVQPAAKGNAFARWQLRVLQAHVPLGGRLLAGLLLGRILQDGWVPQAGTVTTDEVRSFLIVTFSLGGISLSCTPLTV